MCTREPDSCSLYGTFVTILFIKVSSWDVTSDLQQGSGCSWLISALVLSGELQINTCIMNYFFKEMDSPVGRLKLVGSDRGLAAVLWEDDNPKRVRVREYMRDDNHPILLDAEKQLKEYFAGPERSLR